MTSKRELKDMADMSLPLSVTSQADVRRLIREVQTVDDFLNQSAIRNPGMNVQMPKSSRLLDELARENQLNLLQTEDRRRLGEFLQTVRTRAPVLHMSFSADPSPLFMQKMMNYLRREIHPLVLVSTGLQPTIGAGCILRTTNQHFDFSLRQRFADKRELLVELLKYNAKPQTVREAEA